MIWCHYEKGVCPPWQPFFKIARKINDNAENCRFNFDENNINGWNIIVYCFKNVQAMKLQIKISSTASKMFIDDKFTTNWVGKTSKFCWVNLIESISYLLHNLFNCQMKEKDLKEQNRHINKKRCPTCVSKQLKTIVLLK